MVTAALKELQTRAKRLAKKIPGAKVEPGKSQVGGGAFPEAPLETWLVTIAPPSVDRLLDQLRAHQPPVIARALDGKVALDVRTLADEEFETVADAVARAQAPR
jgi:L-seryl-tRNA(Ser) seleniumtransferase